MTSWFEALTLSTLVALTPPNKVANDLVLTCGNPDDIAIVSQSSGSTRSTRMQERGCLWQSRDQFDVVSTTPLFERHPVHRLLTLRHKQTGAIVFTVE